MTATTSLIPFDNNHRHIVEDNSLLQIDQEFDALLEQIEDEIEEHGEASRESMDRLQVFAEAMNLKVDPTSREHSLSLKYSLVPRRNEGQKIESNVEILEGRLGCMKSTHSMNSAAWGR